MKITKRQLKRIIKEERAKLLKEAYPRRPGAGLSDSVLDSSIINNVKDKLAEYAINMVLKSAPDLHHRSDVLTDVIQGTGLSGNEVVDAIAIIAREMNHSEMTVQDFEDDMLGLFEGKKSSSRQLRRIIKEATEDEQLQLPLSSDTRKVEMIEDVADFLMRGPKAVAAAVEGYDNMSAEKLNDYLESLYTAASEAMTFNEKYGSQRDDIMRVKVADQLGLR